MTCEANCTSAFYKQFPLKKSSNPCAIASLCFTRPSLSFNGRRREGGEEGGTWSHGAHTASPCLDGRRGGEEVGEADPSLWGGEKREKRGEAANLEVRIWCRQLNNSRAPNNVSGLLFVLG